MLVYESYTLEYSGFLLPFPHLHCFPGPSTTPLFLLTSPCTPLLLSTLSPTLTASFPPQGYNQLPHARLLRHFYHTPSPTSSALSPSLTASSSPPEERSQWRGGVEVVSLNATSPPASLFCSSTGHPSNLTGPCFLRVSLLLQATSPPNPTQAFLPQTPSSTSPAHLPGAAPFLNAPPRCEPPPPP